MAYTVTTTVATSRATDGTNKLKARTSSARGVMEDRSRFGLLLLQRQFGEVVPILHKHKQQFSLNVCPKSEEFVDVNSLRHNLKS